jgi:hypothetical protein
VKENYSPGARRRRPVDAGPGNPERADNPAIPIKAVS